MTNTAEVTRASLFKERVIHGLIFLFPIAGVGVRHWFSLIFTLLVLMSLWDWFRSAARAPLLREEKIWLWLCVGFFFSSLLSGVANGWTDTQAKLLAVDLRYLAIVPLYFMLRRYPQAWRYLLVGLLPAAIFVAGQAFR
jgi:CDP-diglyceride synthetase